jgi:hypothetical protein
MRARAIRHCLLAALLFVAAVPGFAQKDPRSELGFHPEKLFDYTEIDSVNLFNGNLVMNIPLGPRYQVGPSLSYQFALTYNGKVWDYESYEQLTIDGLQPRTEALPNRRSNAGVGWRISFGRLLPPRDSTGDRSSDERTAFVYESPDGAEHGFTSGTGDVGIALDASALRLIDDSGAKIVEFPSGERHRFVWEENDWRLKSMYDRFGNTVIFDYQYGDHHRVSSCQITDSELRTHTIAYWSSPTMHESVDRGQQISLLKLQQVPGSPGSGTSFQFQYQELSIRISRHGNSVDLRLPMLTTLDLPDGTAASPSQFRFTYYTDRVSGNQGAMQSMTLPTGGRIDYTYQYYWFAARRTCANGYGPSIEETGIATRTITEGTTSRQWEYVSRRGPSVPVDYPDVHGDYCCIGTPPSHAAGPFYWTRTSVLAPLENHDGTITRTRTDHYFDVYSFDFNLGFSCPSTVPTGPPVATDPFAPPGDGPFQHFGYPGTVGAPPPETAAQDPHIKPENDPSYPHDQDSRDSAGRRLTTQVYAGCAANGACPPQNLKRSTYSDYEVHPLSSWSYLIYPNQDYTPASLQLRSSRTVFHDDHHDHTDTIDPGCEGDCETTTTYSEPNGVGQYRTMVEESNFPHSPKVTTFTKYLDWGEAVRLYKATNWITSQFEEKTRTEVLDGTTTTSKSELRFNSTNGTLEATRIVGGNETCENGRCSDDVLALYSYDSKGRMVQEQSYGGDGGQLGTSACCAAPSTGPQYLIRHTYTDTNTSAGPGYNYKSEYLDPATCTDISHAGCVPVPVLTIADGTINKATSLVTESRDASGIATSYSYDDVWRLSSVSTPTPIGTTVSSYVYAHATADRNALATETVKGHDNAVLTTATWEFDGLGRIRRASKSLPNGKVATVQTDYDVLGRKYRVSQPVEQTTHPTSDVGTDWTATLYDAFGRPLSVQSPGPAQNVVHFDYTGARKSVRTVSVATSATGTTPAETTEYYDGLGRLIAVEENAADTSAASPVGGKVRTTYTYDIGGHLASVTMTAGQTTQPSRFFVYDKRGFLLQETHPENGITTYADYDARGHAQTRTSGGKTLTFDYDAAERPTTISNGAGVPIKELTFASDNDGTDWRKGKLVTAVRHNDLPSAGKIDVTESYEYRNDSGQLSKRTTTVEKVVGTTRNTIQQFVYGVPQYDDLRAPKQITMPTCVFHGCSAGSGLANVEYTRTAGFLTGVTGFGKLAYSPSGMVHTVTHASTPESVDTYEPANGLARPSVITFGGGSCTTPQPPVINVGAVCSGTASSASVAAVQGLGYTWTIIGGTLTNSTGESVTFQPTAATVTLSVTASNSCEQTASNAKTVTVGGAPEASIITAPAGLCAGAAGGASVAAREGITHTWSIAGGTITSSATGNSITFQPAGPGVVMLSVTATSACGSATRTKPIIVSSPPTATLNGSAAILTTQSTQIPVELSGIGPWTVVWSDGVTENYSHSPGLRTVQPTQTTTHTVTSVADAFGCSGTAAGSFVVTVSQAPAQHVSSYQKYHSMYSPSHAAILWLDMDPAPSSEATDPGPTVSAEWHRYAFKWLEDDGVHPLRVLNGTGREIAVQPDGNAVYWAEIKGTHRIGNSATYQQLTVSPHMYVFLYADCHMPDLHVSQNLGALPAGSATPIRFNALVDWPNVHYQWYEGRSGDTRSPIASDNGLPGRLTVIPNPIIPHWVRASLACGTTQDSETLTFTVGDCAPVLIDPNVASRTVAWGGNASLNVNLVNVLQPAFTWYSGEGELTPVTGGTQQTLSLTDVRKSGRYWVKVRNTFCNDSAPARSFLAAVRVGSCATITPPAQWQTEFWADLNGSTTLSVSAGGATGYQWFRGEVGDESQLIPGAVQSTYVTGNLTQESKYWVRVYGSSSCVVDSPTLTVRICEPPHLTGSAFQTNENIVPGQWAAFTIPMAGTALQYRWYQGAPGDTSTPVGRAVDKLMVHPTETTSYWVDVWAPCGPNGSDQRHFAPSPVFTASVCPALYQEPTAAKTIVMPGTTTTLSIGSPDQHYTYQWYIGDPAVGTSTPMGAPTSASSVTTPPLNQTTTFWVAITSGGCMVPSAGVTVAVCPSLPLQIMVSHPNVGPGYFQWLTLSGVPADTPLLYQWYQGPAGNTSTPISSQAAAGVSPMVTTSYWMRVTMTDTNCYADSPVVTINVCAPSLTTQPVASTTIDKGSNPSASVHLTVGTDITAVTYQWYIGQPGNTANPIAGATAGSYDASPSATTTYWVRVTGTCSTYANSAAATVNVCYAPSISPMGGTRFIQQGGSAPIAVIATGTNLTYKWYAGASGNTSNPVAYGSTASIMVSPTSTTTYWAQVKSEGLCSANSPTVTVDVCTAPSFTTQPESRLSFAGNPVPLTALATSGTGPVSYQWYQGLTGDASAPISGATSPSLTVSPATETSYWVRATTSLCSTDSTTATIAMCIYPEVITPSPSEKYIGYGATATLQVPPLSPVDNIGVTWYRGASGDRANLVASALNLTSYTTPALTSTTQYWAEITHNTCLSRTTSYTVSVCVSAITAQPTGGTIQSGQSKTLTVGTTAISGQTLQWYTGAAGNMTAPVTGATSGSLTVTPTTTMTYWVRVTGPCGPPANSTAATVTVCTPPVISSTSANPAAIQLGSSTTLLVSATAVNKTYQWYIGPSGTTSSPVAYGTDGSITVAPNATTTYWVQVKSEGFCTTNSPAVTVDVCTTPVITTQPQSQTIRIGQPATLTVATSTGGATVQWYQGAPGTTTAPLGTTASINVTPSADTQYWARVTKGACSIDSSGATITVCALTVAMPNVNAASGQNATLTATVTNARAAVTYMWYRGNTGDTTNPVSGSSVPQITVNRTANTNYWVRATDGTCTLDSATATLFICVPTITTQPQSVTIISGQSTTLSVAATGSPLTYQWYAGDSGVTTSPISGATSSSYTTPALTTLSKYWARVTGCSVANSATATVTVCIAPSTPSAPTKSGTVNPGQAAWVSISASGTGLTYQWYKGQSGDMSRPIGGATAATYNFTLSVSEYYWVRVSGACGTPANSAATLYSVMPAITVQPQSPSIPSGTSTTLSVTATGNFLTYQWFNASMQPITGATSPAYTTPALTSETWFYVRVYSGTLIAYANPATVTICAGPAVWMTYAQHSTHSYTLIVQVDEADAGNVKFQWYTGTPGNVSQSTPQGPIGGQSQWYLGNVTQPTTWWVRAWYLDDHCYTDTQGITVY